MQIIHHQPAGHLEQMQSFFGPRVPQKSLKPVPCTEELLPWGGCSSVPWAGAAVDRAVVGEALVHPLLFGWGCAQAHALDLAECRAVL